MKHREHVPGPQTEAIPRNPPVTGGMPARPNVRNNVKKLRNKPEREVPKPFTFPYTLYFSLKTLTLYFSAANLDFFTAILGFFCGHLMNLSLRFYFSSELQHFYFPWELQHFYFSRELQRLIWELQRLILELQRLIWWTVGIRPTKVPRLLVWQ